jgi:hypothetical protein
MLSWGELQLRLTAILDASPRPEYLKNPDPCIQRVIRLRDIAVYCGIDRQEVYRVRRGERSLKPEVQKVLSWFFGNLDSGKLVKECQADGKWRIVYRNPASKVPADAAYAGSPAIKAQVDFLTGKLKLQ